MNKIACALLSYNRPDYLKQVLLSITKNKNYNQFDWHFFQDGCKLNQKFLCDPNLIKQCLDFIEDFPANNKKIQVNEKNEGVARQKNKIHELFKIYDKIIVFEDDMVLSPHYLKILLTMNKQYPYYVVQACDKTSGLPKDNFKNHLLEAEFSGCHWWGYLMPYNVYKAIKPLFDKYIELIGDDYRNRPSEKIKETFNIQATSHDAILSKHLDDNIIKKLTMAVPRAKYIGESGLHSNPSWYKKHKFHIEKPYIFNKDQILDLEEIQIVPE